jgi:hypothetical protein
LLRRVPAVDVPDRSLTPAPLPAIEDTATSSTMIAVGPASVTPPRAAATVALGQAPLTPPPQAAVTVALRPASLTPPPRPTPAPIPAPNSGEQAVITRLTEILLARIETGAIPLPALRPRVQRLATPDGAPLHQMSTRLPDSDEHYALKWDSATIALCNPVRRTTALSPSSSAASGERT